jgi:hypothetical protein
MILRLAAVIVLASCGAVDAGESVDGRWAADPAGCNSGLFDPSPLVVTESSLRWHDESCRIARMYKTGNTVHIEAQCLTRDGARSVPVSLRPHAGRLELSWNRVRSGDLARCR